MEADKEIVVESTRPHNKPVVFNYFDEKQFETAQRLSQMLAMSELVPEQYRIKSDSDKNASNKAIANCVIALEMASRIGVSPLMVMQNMYIVNGKPSWSSKFHIAVINGCGRYKALKYKAINKGKINWCGNDIDNIEVIAYTTEVDSQDILYGSPCSIEMAIKEGWFSKKDRNGKEISKWQTMPIKMLRYRAASFWANEYAPELSMGMYTVEENEDIENPDFDDYEEVKEKPKIDASKILKEEKKQEDLSDDCGY